MDKADIRSVMRAKRRLVGQEARLEYARTISELLDTELADAQTIAVYLALEQEIPLDPFIKSSTAKGKMLCVPAWYESKRTYGLAALGTAPDFQGEAPKLVEGKFGVLEPRPAIPVDPAKVDAWIIPGLAFTKDGWRLGYGGGFYDRLLADARPGSRKLGVAYPFQILPDLPLEGHDIRLDAVIATQVNGLPS